MTTKRLHIPYRITEFDKEMLFPLDGNFSQIQKHVSALEEKVETLELSLTAAIEALTLAHNSLVEAVEGYHP